jgi:hypothetical protein
MASTLLGSTSMPTPALSAAECDGEAALGRCAGRRTAAGPRSLVLSLSKGQVDYGDGSAVGIEFLKEGLFCNGSHERVCLFA